MWKCGDALKDKMVQHSMCAGGPGGVYVPC